MHRKLLVAAAAILFCQTAASLELVRDINETFTSASGATGVYAEVNASVALMIVDDGVRGPELWTTDGTAAGTRLLRDINPGPAGCETRAFTVINGVAYFLANDGTNGVELWRSDGTAAGTSIVANIGPGATNSGPVALSSPLFNLNGLIYFVADDGSGDELWRSDGTRTGTYRLRDIRPGPVGSDPRGLTIAGSSIFFSADDGTNGYEAWITDGTAAGTRRVADIAPGAASAFAGNFVVSGSTVYFVADDGTHGTEVWRAPISGTSAALIVDLETRIADPSTPNRTLGSEPRLIGAAGDGVLLTAVKSRTLPNGTIIRERRLYHANSPATTLTPIMDVGMFANFTVFFRFADRLVLQIDSNGSNELWTSNGTVAGTFPLRPGGAPLFPNELSSLNRAVVTSTEAFFFAAVGPTNGGSIDLWRTDGTTAGTTLYATTPKPFFASDLTRFDGRFYFRAGSAADPAGSELWSADGTPIGTQRVIDLNPGQGHSLVDGLAVVLSRLMFTATDGVTGIEPYVSDGTEAGTVRLGDFNTTVVTNGSNPHSLRRLGSRVLLFADDGINGQELWSSDGTTAGTQLVADLASGSDSLQFPQWLGEVPGGLLFHADDGVAGRELWITDGTSGGTRLVADIALGPAHSDPGALGAFVINDVAYFAANDGTNGQEIWRSDGTTQGTSMVVELTPDATGNVFLLGVIGNRLVFKPQSAPAGELWVTDGTPGGTQLLAAGVEPEADNRLVELGGSLYFFARDARLASQLWRTDGTPGGTTQATNPGGSESLSGTNFVRAGSRLVFSGCSSDQGCGLYASDGTHAGTTKVSDVGPQGGFFSDGSLVYFLSGSIIPPRIFVSDGTAAGTREFLPPGVNLNGTPLSMTLFSGSLLIVVQDSTTGGPVIWRSDGTVQGTTPYASITPSPAERGVGQFVQVGTRLFLTADEANTADELFVIDADRPFAQNDDVRTAFQTEVSVAVLGNDATVNSPLNVGSVEILAAPTSGTASVTQATGEIRYTPNAGFAGFDTLTYRVRDNLGTASNAGRVTITVANAAGGGPGTAPQPPPPPPPPSPPPPPDSGSGGGGSVGWLLLLVLGSLLLLHASGRRYRVAL